MAILINRTETVRDLPGRSLSINDLRLSIRYDAYSSLKPSRQPLRAWLCAMSCTCDALQCRSQLGPQIRARASEDYLWLMLGLVMDVWRKGWMIANRATSYGLDIEPSIRPCSKRDEIRKELCTLSRAWAHRGHGKLQLSISASSSLALPSSNKSTNHQAATIAWKAHQGV